MTVQNLGTKTTLFWLFRQMTWLLQVPTALVLTSLITKATSWQSWMQRQVVLLSPTP